MLPFPLHTVLCRSVMPVNALCRSAQLCFTLQCLAPLCATHAAVRLSVFLLQDLGSSPICNTKIFPYNTEEFILNSKRMNEHIWGRDTLHLILLHAPPENIKHLNYGTKHCYLHNKNSQETISTCECTSFSSSKPLHTWLGIQLVPAIILNLLSSTP